MADLSNSSFIPKQGPVKSSKTSSTRKVYFFTLMSYTLMFATLLGAGGMFFYSKYIEGQLAREVTLLNNEIASFDESSMQRVQEFDLRLRQASNRLSNSASVLSIFETLEETTIESVSLDSLSIARNLDTNFTVEAVLSTDSFDSTIFQRGVYKRYSTVVDSVLVEISQVSGLDGLTGSSNTNNQSTVKAEVTLDIPLSAVPYMPRGNNAPVNVQAVNIFEEINLDSENEEFNQQNI